MKRFATDFCLNAVFFGVIMTAVAGKFMTMAA